MTGDSACGWPACGRRGSPAGLRPWRRHAVGAGGSPAVAPRRREPALYPLPGRGTRSGGAGGGRRAAARSPVAGDVAGGPPGGMRARDPGPGLGRRGAGGTLPARPGGVVSRRAGAGGALGEAVAARLLAENHDEGVRQVQFPHPLVRAAIYADLSPARRAALHLSAARLTAGTVALSHRVAAAAGPDAALAAELAELAGRRRPVACTRPPPVIHQRRRPERGTRAAGRPAAGCLHLVAARRRGP